MTNDREKELQREVDYHSAGARAAERELSELRISKILLDRSDISSDSIKLGYWSCPDSPTGSCVYDLDSDFGDDECIYCLDPRERK